MRPISKINIAKENFSFENEGSIINLKSISTKEAQLAWKNVEFYLYNINLVDTRIVNKLKVEEFLDTLRFNLSQTDFLCEGDIVGIERPFYQHHAVVIDISRMIVTHTRTEVPQNLVRTSNVFISLGIFTENDLKLKITESHLVDLAGHNRIVNNSIAYSSRYSAK